LALPEPGGLGGLRVVVTAGGTREPIDPVRYLGNRSSGKMGNALAHAAAGLGAGVMLITTVAPPPPKSGVQVIRVETADEMNDAVHAALPGAVALLMAAAVADYRPARVAASKLKKDARPWSMELVPTTDILASLRDDPARNGVLVVGFAAETDDLMANAQAKLAAKGLDLVVVNDVSRSDIAMGSDQNEVTIIDSAGVVAHVVRAPKAEVAESILRVVLSRITAPRS
jgi:phosphopantothenoylcysteine decarboxylase/phosphopantothenate--cysteine ligase